MYENGPFNLPPFAIPGLMTVSAPKAAARHSVEPDGSLNIVIWCQDAALPAQAVAFRILDEEHKIQYEDLTGAHVFHELENGKRVYRIKLPVRSVGLGSFVLAVYVAGQPFQEYDIVRSRDGFSDWQVRNSFYQKPPELSGSAVVVPSENLP